ncbi:MAG: M23 family metallopeptidase [Bacteroidetes bacterium]|nr:M23 family metallopeptidase [Bacteroidota bacterium]
MSHSNFFRLASRSGSVILFVAALIGCSFIDSDKKKNDTGYDPPWERRGCDGQDYLSIEETPYVLPYPVGKRYKMNLGNCSTSYHAAEYPDRYAYDFDMPIGTLITASRAGRVFMVVESGVDFNSSVNNLVVVDHGDGTYAEYMHLTHNGAVVKNGDMVEKGDSIGYSGATGLAGYPHLHFILVRDNPSWPYKPVPVTFGNASPADRILDEGTRYEAKPW